MPWARTFEAKAPIINQRRRAGRRRRNGLLRDPKGRLMNLLLRPVRSSLGSKYVMAVTGLGLIGFVIAHMLGNLQIFLGKQALNDYARHLEEIPTILWSARVGLLAIFVIHILFGLRLWRHNRAA